VYVCYDGNRNLTQAYTGFVARVRTGALRHVRYRYSVSVSVQAKSIGVGGIGKFWYRSKPSYDASQYKSELSVEVYNK